MVITAIKQQQRKQNRVNVFLDGAFAFALHLKVAERLELKPGMDLSQAGIDAVLRAQAQQECTDKAISYLSRRMHSRNELRLKLLRAEHQPDVIEATLSRLQELGYVNDEEFARQKLGLAQRKLIGERRAIAELLRSGVKGEVARQAVRQHFSSDDAKDNAAQLIEKNLPRLQRLDPVTAKRRLIGLLQRRGFDYETIKPLVDSALGREEPHEPLDL